jgi:hypothetical protein
MLMIVCVAATSKMETKRMILPYSFSTEVQRASGVNRCVCQMMLKKKIRMSPLLLSIFNVGVVQKYALCCIAVYIE